MKNNEFEIFMSGLVLGIIGFAGLLIATGATPLATSKRWEIEAIKGGYGEMVVNGDRLKFQWKKQPK